MFKHIIMFKPIITAILAAILFSTPAYAADSIDRITAHNIYKNHATKACSVLGYNHLKVKAAYILSTDRVLDPTNEEVLPHDLIIYKKANYSHSQYLRPSRWKYQLFQNDTPIQVPTIIEDVSDLSGAFDADSISYYWDYSGNLQTIRTLPSYLHQVRFEIPESLSPPFTVQVTYDQKLQKRKVCVFEVTESGEVLFHKKATKQATKEYRRR